MEKHAMLGRLASLVGLGKLTATRDDAPVRLAQVRLSAVEVRDQTAMLQNYGFSSRPHPGADTAFISLHGDRSRMVIIATHDQRYFLALAEGEVAIHDDLGRSVTLSRAGIVINGGGAAVTVTGDLQVSGNVIAGYGGADQVGLQTHKHPANNTAPTAGT